MSCEQCREREAVIHLTQIVNEQVTTLHLCERCAAEMYQKACEDLYFDRITRGSEDFLVTQLGAYAAELSCLSHFFTERW